MEENLYTLEVDGVVYKSSSPLTEEVIKRKSKILESSAFEEGEGSSECPDCPKD